jgi:hypothetical protein
MLTTAVSGFLLVLLSHWIHGVVAGAVLFIGVWLAKNGLLLWFLSTQWGKRVTKAIRWVLYTKLGRTVARVSYRVICVITSVEKWAKNRIISLKNRLKNLYFSVK